GRGVLEEAISRDPRNGNVLLQQAILFRRLNETAQAETILRDLAADLARNDMIRSQAHYELAQMLDDAQRYDEAFQAFVSAKQLLRPQARQYVQLNDIVLAKNQETIDSIDAAAYERWRKLPENEPNYRIATLTSHPRSGTTLIEQVLDSHDQLKSADEF